MVKVSALHVYSHQDGDTDTIENCENCETAIENQQAEHSVSFPFNLNSIAIPMLSNQKATPLISRHTSYTLRFQLFGRPPPVIG